MGQLNQRHILVAISGGIAAYKGAELVRLLKKQGAFVRVVLSRGATEFITPLTMQALSGQPTHTELLDEAASGSASTFDLAAASQTVQQQFLTLSSEKKGETLARLADCPPSLEVINLSGMGLDNSHADALAAADTALGLEPKQARGSRGNHWGPPVKDAAWPVGPAALRHRSSRLFLICLPFLFFLVNVCACLVLSFVVLLF